MIAFVVDIEGVRLSVDFEMPFVDTVSETSDERAEIASVFEITLYGIIPQKHVRRTAVLIGKDEALYNPAQRKHLHAFIAVRESISVYFSPVGHFVEYRFCNFCHINPPYAESSAVKFFQLFNSIFRRGRAQKNTL